MASLTNDRVDLLSVPARCGVHEGRSDLRSISVKNRPEDQIESLRHIDPREDGYRARIDKFKLPKAIARQTKAILSACFCPRGR